MIWSESANGNTLRISITPAMRAFRCPLCSSAIICRPCSPQLNKWLQLEPFPDDGFRNAILLVLVLDIVAAFFWDRLMLLVFAPKILWASVAGTTWKDVVNALKVVVICYGVIYVLATVRLGWRDFVHRVLLLNFVGIMLQHAHIGESYSASA